MDLKRTQWYWELHKNADNTLNSQLKEKQSDKMKKINKNQDVYLFRGRV